MGQEVQNLSIIKLLSFSLIIFGLTLLSWFSSTSLASKLEKSTEMPGHKHRDEQGNTQKPVNFELKEDDLIALEKKVTENKSNKDPKSIEVHLEFANLLLERGSENSNVSYIIKSVAEYNKVVEKDPVNHKALLSLARISFESGAIQNSISYFENYLKLKPEDTLAKNDLALAHLQNQEIEKAIIILKEITEDKPKYFESHLALALAYNYSGEKESALKLAKRSLSLAIDPKQKIGASELIKSLNSSEKDSSTKEDKNLISPATEIKKYLTSHPILSGKIVKIFWPESNKVSVVLSDFPINQMPEFAKNVFKTKTKEKLKGLPGNIEITLFDEKNVEDKLKILLSEKVHDVKK